MLEVSVDDIIKNTIDILEGSVCRKIEFTSYAIFLDPLKDF